MLLLRLALIILGGLCSSCASQQSTVYLLAGSPNEHGRKAVGFLNISQGSSLPFVAAIGLLDYEQETFTPIQNLLLPSSRLPNVPRRAGRVPRTVVTSAGLAVGGEWRPPIAVVEMPVDDGVVYAFGLDLGDSMFLEFTGVRLIEAEFAEARRLVRPTRLTSFLT